MRQVEDFWAVVPAGGAGTRLWPLSRAGRPKFLLDLTGSGRTLLQATVDRLAPLSGERLLVVTGRAHADAVRRQLALPADRLLAEPSPRDSMAAIGWAAALLERRHPDAVLGSFAADHVIGDAEEFRDTVRRAVEVAREGWLVTLGIAPTHPATGFGYVQAGRPLPEHPGVVEAAAFVEKPSAEAAAAYVAAGDHRWNAGMFVVRPGVLLGLLAEHHPGLAESLRGLAAGEVDLDATWPTLEPIALDHAVAEPAAAQGRVAMVPAEFDWDDIGGFDALARLLAAGAGADAGGPDGLTVLGDGDRVHALDAQGLVVPGSGRVVALLGLDDIIVVDTDDAVLVARSDRLQDLKRIVAALPPDQR